RLEDGKLRRWYMDPLFNGHYPQDVIEHLGDTVIAHARWAPDQPLIAVRLAPDSPPPRAGDAVGLRIRTERAHFFDAEGHAIAA
ncbi:TOBE domain-containing protein, partial [Mitsuaria sp. TWR114]|uniref:TOBE domain-containing protein n=1 Tax=Mitsuaria sp. TWR114 TaxID=2601731 RepID=UPI0011BE46A5